METSVFSSSNIFNAAQESGYVKDSHRSSNLDKSFMPDYVGDCDFVEESDPRYFVEGYDMPDYDNDREIEEYLHELAIADELNEYYAYVDAMTALEPKRFDHTDTTDDDMFPRSRKKDTRFYIKPIQNDQITYWLVIDAKDYSFEALKLTEREALNLATSLNNRLTSVY